MLTDRDPLLITDSKDTELLSKVCGPPYVLNCLLSSGLNELISQLN